MKARGHTAGLGGPGGPGLSPSRPPGPSRQLPVLPIEPVPAPAQQADPERGFLPVIPQGRQRFRRPGHAAPQDGPAGTDASPLPPPGLARLETAPPAPAFRAETPGRPRGEARRAPPGSGLRAPGSGPRRGGGASPGPRRAGFGQRGAEEISSPVHVTVPLPQASCRPGFSPGTPPQVKK